MFLLKALLFSRGLHTEDETGSLNATNYTNKGNVANSGGADRISRLSTASLTSIIHKNSCFLNLNQTETIYFSEFLIKLEE